MAGVIERLGNLELRMGRIEVHLGLPPVPEPTIPPVVRLPARPGAFLNTGSIREAQAAFPPLVPAAPTPPPLPPFVVNDSAASAVETPEPPLEVDWPASSAATSAPVLSYALSAPSPPPAKQSALEQTIGLKWAGWVGAIVLVIGAGLGIKFAYENGWFNVISPSLRLALMFTGGFALIAAGEYIFRKVSTLSAVGLFGAGVAVLFLVSFAGHRYYHLYPRQAAYLLMALATVIGAAVAMRGNLVSIAVLSLIGGNLAPVVLGGDTGQLIPFMSYLLMLQVVALFLAAWGDGRKWWTLRAVALGSTSLWTLLLVGSSQAEAAPVAAISFVLIYSMLYHTELIISTVRAKSDVAASVVTGRRADGSVEAELANPGVVFAALVTAATVAAVLAFSHDSSDFVRGLMVLGTGAVSGIAGLLLPSKRIAVLRGLRIGYRVQAAMLLVAAVPVGLSGVSVEFGWAILACGFAVLAALLNLRISRIAAASTWALAVAHLLNRLINADPSASNTWFTLFHTGIPVYVGIAGGLSVLGHVIGRCILPRQGRSGEGIASTGSIGLNLGVLVSAAASAVWVVASVSALPPVGATLSLVLLAWALFGGDIVTDRLGFAAQAVAVLALATVKWAVVDTLRERLSPVWSATQYAPIWNPVMGMGLLIAGSLTVLGWLRRRSLMKALDRWTGAKATERDAILMVAGLVTVLMAVGLSFEIDRAVERAREALVVTPWPWGQLKHLSWTMLWTAATCTFLGLVQRVEPSSARRLEWLRPLGDFLVAIGVKFFAIDTVFYRTGFDAVLATPVMNLQVLTAATVVGGLVMLWYLARSAPTANAAMHNLARTAAGLVVLTLLLTGSIEIDRFFERAALGRMMPVDAALAKQVAFSIYWALFAVGSVVAGFRIRAAVVRYFGLGLFGVTLLKVFFVDLANIGSGYRVLSFMGLGLLLLGTSVLYGRLSPKLLGTGTVAAAEQAA